MKKEKKERHFIEQPTYPGGDKAMTAFIYQHLRYPKLALESKLQGTVYLEFGIDYQGNVVETRTIQPLGHGCDEEAARVVKMLKFEMGKYRGMKVVFHKKAKIHFQLPKPQILPAAPPQNPGQAQVQYNYVPAEPKPNLPSSEELPAQQMVYTYTYSINQ